MNGEAATPGSGTNGIIEGGLVGGGEPVRPDGDAGGVNGGIEGSLVGGGEPLRGRRDASASSPPPRLRAREAGLFRALVSRVVAPRGSLPPVGDTDAVAAFASTLSLSPRLNRLGLRSLLWGARTGRLPAGAAQAMSAIAHLSYYGDDRVARSLGYDPDAVVARGHAVRKVEARW